MNGDGFGGKACNAAIAKLHAALEAGALVPAVEHILPLEDAAKAHEIVMSPGRAGAVLLSIE